MVPFSSFSTGRWTIGSPKLERFTGVPSVAIVGEPAAGVSTGAAMDAMTELVDKLPPGIGIRWAGLSYEERLSGSQGPALYAISMLIVFLCLAALYESWSIPAAVLLIVPLGVIGTLLAATFRSLPNDVYFQVGLLIIVGLSAKNAILIVEFARRRREEGLSIQDAAIDAALVRLRPILMTALAFILGVVPLVLASGAGANSRHSLGTAVFGGMIVSTVLSLAVVPVMYVVIERLREHRPRLAQGKGPEESPCETLGNR